jgi:hypothetical protein
MSYSYNKRKHEIDRFKKGVSALKFVKRGGKWKIDTEKKDKREGIKGDQGTSGCVGVEI